MDLGEDKMRWWRFVGHPAVLRAGGLMAVLRQARLTFRLLRDERVPVAAKLLVPGALAYLISPLDLVPDLIPLLGQVDDIGLVLLAVAAFVKMCPSHIVSEHEAALDGREPTARTPGRDEPIDAKYRWVNEQPSP